MCGIIGIVANQPANQPLYDGLLVLQHRGQDAAGIVTSDGSRFHMHKNNGLVKDVFHTRHMRTLKGNAGICLLYTSPSPRDATLSRMPSSA